MSSIWLSLFSHGRGAFWYNTARKWFTIGSLLVSPVLMVINAPFGRFTLQGDSRFLVDGIKSWISMELVSPAVFMFAFKSSPLSYYPTALPSLYSPQTLFASLFFIHYLNRAIISPLRTPSRSKSHIIVPLAAVVFNTINGFLMGSYFSSPYVRIMFSSQTYQQPTFIAGITLWALGFAGNIMHDEILLNIRRNAKTKDKAKEENEDADGKPKERAKEHYAIPQGLLYKYVSYPNYFCEWVEWFGFALASAPFPVELSLGALFSLFSKQTWSSIISSPPQAFAPNLAPPWIFLLSEVMLMLPRAYKGHLWYKEKFGDRYPKERRIVIPLVL
ncbi:hypothetical protein BDQ12DRAFT_689131 [Crucibulum laeve]|uniref:3-oxo-5-alpha-steroid 4-dehydrogenase C-terminal domain-containing protein n=1 Tax=Crucibulum laeve TaxID=68775 RepID=A0A5C3LPR9_9AGAR|nr:hypothetical protein BDQ12DRAFT_689131 [Crucibulum laeve]